MEKVTIVLSVYRPDPRYLEEQLLSLNGQTYRNLELLVWNDCPGEKIDRELFDRCITRFPVFFFGGEENLGYIRAFEKLTELAEGDYISYCDQDDIWEPDKISSSMEAIRKNGAVAAVCDRSVIDADGKVVCDSVRRSSREKRMTWKTGEDITRYAAFVSYCTGMTLIARRELLQQYLPLVSGLPHDQQLIFFLSASGTIANVEVPLVRHRRYGTNASGTLAGVDRKQDYYRTRCEPVNQLLARFEALFPDYPELERMKRCSLARTAGNARGIWKYRDLIPDLYRYEAALALCPDWVFRALKGILFRKEG